jgi:hypothetical protein
MRALGIVGIRTADLLSQRNDLTDRECGTSDTTLNRPFTGVLNGARYYVSDILRRGECNFVIISGVPDQRAAVLKVKRRLDGFDVLGGVVRARQVVYEEARLEETVLNLLFVLVELREILPCEGFVGVPWEVLKGRPADVSE